MCTTMPIRHPMRKTNQNDPAASTQGKAGRGARPQASISFFTAVSQHPPTPTTTSTFSLVTRGRKSIAILLEANRSPSETTTTFPGTFTHTHTRTHARICTATIPTAPVGKLKQCRALCEATVVFPHSLHQHACFPPNQAHVSCLE